MKLPTHGRLLAQEHEWRTTFGSNIVQPTVRRSHSQAHYRKGEWDWLLWTFYITFCIVSVLLAAHWFFPEMWR